MDKKQKPVIYTVATAHLDTIWNWDFEQTVREYIPATLDKNFRLFQKYPEYVFSFEGSYRYELMQEYYPEKFKTLCDYIRDGRWFVTGSAFENGDVNVPSPEALFRNILYGNHYFRDTFGKTSVDIYLPDCFGFGYALPSIIHHAGLLGFTTQKLTWSSAYGIPFDLGFWQGVDGSRVTASLDGQSYSATLKTVRGHKKAAQKLEKNIKDYDLPMTYLLHGTGDRGGSPTDKSVRTVVSEKRKNDKSNIDVEIVSADGIHRILNTLSDEQKAKLPVWNNELVSTDHGVGGYTSRAIGKRWNKQNEQLADAAERYSVFADWLGAAPYPKGRLDTAWKRVIAHQFHDDLPGTSLQHCYKRSWNDYMLSLNQFGGIYENAVEAVVRQMQVPFQKGIAVAVSNPTQWTRRDAVACKVDLPEGTQLVRVKNAAGKAVPAQISGGEVIFTAEVPANGIAIYCITSADKPYAKDTGLSVTARTLENKQYRVTLDDNGDIVSVFAKTLNKELLSAPIRMELRKYNGSRMWPAWELDYSEVMAPPHDYAKNPTFRIVEEGPARVVLETRRTAGESVFVQRLVLGEASDSVRVENEIEWRSLKTLLKTPFTLTVENEQASYDLGLGVIRRGLNTKKLYEVPAQNFADISGTDYGVTILSDCKYGWDHPDKKTLRLTGIHTPRGNFRKESQQSQMDLGRNRYAFGIFAHVGADLTESQRAGVQFSQPMRVFYAPLGNDGILPSAYSFASVSDDAVLLRAMKQEADGSRWIVRVNEGAGKAHTGVRLKIGNGIAAAYECNASEEVLGDAKIENGELVFDITPYAPKTFALELVAPAEKATVLASTPVRLAYNAVTATPNHKRARGILGGYTLPKEQFPETVACRDAVFALSKEEQNAVTCCGQVLPLPAGTKSVALLLTSRNGDKTVSIRCGDKTEEVFVPDCFEAIGAWDLYGMGEKGCVKPCRLAQEFTHMHIDAGDEIAKQCYLFYAEMPTEADTLTLPIDEDILVFAVTANAYAKTEGALCPLYDTLKKEPFTYRAPAKKFQGLNTLLQKLGREADEEDL